MDRMVKVLELCRDNDDPQLRELNGKPLETLSKDENLDELKKRGIDGLRLCRLGLIDPRPEFLCRLLSYAIGMEESPLVVLWMRQQKKRKSHQKRNRKRLKQ